MKLSKTLRITSFGFSFFISEGLGALYAYESQVPEIAESKLMV